MRRKRHWLAMTYGKHKGKTIPQIFWTDPDYLAYMYRTGKFSNKYSSDVKFVLERACSIKVPQIHPEGTLAEFLFNDRGTFFGFHLVSKSSQDALEIELAIKAGHSLDD